MGNLKDGIIRNISFVGFGMGVAIVLKNNPRKRIKNTIKTTFRKQNKPCGEKQTNIYQRLKQEGSEALKWAERGVFGE